MIARLRQWLEFRRSARARPLWRRRAVTECGKRTLALSRRLSLMPEYQGLTDAQLIRLAYWGAAGDP